MRCCFHSKSRLTDMFCWQILLRCIQFYSGMLLDWDTSLYHLTLYHCWEHSEKDSSQLRQKKKVTIIRYLGHVHMEHFRNMFFSARTFYTACVGHLCIIFCFPPNLYNQCSSQGCRGYLGYLRVVCMHAMQRAVHYVLVGCMPQAQFSVWLVWKKYCLTTGRVHFSIIKIITIIIMTKTNQRLQMVFFANNCKKKLSGVSDWFWSFVFPQWCP